MAKNPFSDPNFGASASTNTSEASNPFADPEFGKPPKPRTLATVANDTVIEVANAAAGGVASIGNFIKPGNAASGWIDKNIIKAGEDAQSDVVKASKQKFRQEVDSADGIAGELGAVGRYVAQNPLLSAAQAAGSFAGPGLAVKGVTGVKALEKFGPKAVEYAGRAAGALTGAAMSGGDAAGTAYELASKAGATEDQAVSAGRQASVIPAIIGGLSGVVGAEGLLAGGKGFAGGTISKALKTGAVEASGEAVEEGVTQYEGQRAAMPYDKSIDPTKGVAAAAGMGAALGGITGAGASLLSGGQNQPADTGQAEREPTTSPGAAGPAQPGPTSPAAPVAPDWATSPGAAAPNPYGGIDFTREVDTSGLSLADPADTIASRLKPSEVMGLNPAAGALSREVAAFVDAQPFTEVTPIETRSSIGAQRRLGEQPIIDVDAREVIDPQQTIAARLAGPSQSAPLQQAVAQLPYNPATQGDSLADQAPQAIQAATQRTQARAAQAEPSLTDGYGQAWDSLDTETRTSVARSAGARGVLARNVASKGWGDLSPNLRSSISTAIESARSVGAPAIQLGNQPQGASNVGNATAPQAGSVPAAAGAPNALSQGERRAGLSGNGDGVGRVGDGAGQRIAGAGFGEAGTAPVAGRSGVAPTLTQGAAPNVTQAGQPQPAAAGQATPDQGGAGQAGARSQAGGVSAPRPANVEANGLTAGKGLTATFGGKTYPVESVSDAQRKWLQFQETAEAGVSQVGNGVEIRDQSGRQVARVSFNGRAWDMNDNLIAEAPDMTAAPVPAAPAIPQGNAGNARKKVRQHPPTVRGSGALAEVSRALGGISPDLLADLSEKVIRNRTSRTGKKTQYTSWDNPAIPGVGPLFRKGGAGDIAEVARVLEEAGYLEAGANESDPIGAMQRAQEIIKRELRKGGSTTQVGNADAIDAEMRARLEAEMDAAADPWDDFSFAPDDLEVSGYADLNADLQAEVERLIAEAESAGIDTETIREDVARQVGEEASQDDYNTAVKQAIQGILPRDDRATEQAQPARPQQGDRDGIEAAGDPGEEGGRGEGRQGGPDREALTLEAQTEDDLRAKAEREAAATSEAAAEKAAEQERLRREAEARDNKARADATVDDFQLGQTADQQMSGMDDMFGGAQDAAPASETDAIEQPAAQQDEAGDMPMFSRTGSADVRNLITTHNLTADNLRYADSIGGLPAPSIGITKVDSAFGAFGEITLIAEKDMIDPAAGVPVYDRDAWTGRFPTMNFKKVKAKLADAFYERMKPVRELMAGDDGGFISQLWDQIRNASTQSPDKIIDIFDRYEAGRVMYAKDVLGKSIKVPTKPVKPKEFFAHETPWLDFVRAADWQSNDLGANDPAYIELRKQAGAAAMAAADSYIAKQIAASQNDPEVADVVRAVYIKNVQKYLDEDGAMRFGALDRARADAATVGKKEVDRAKFADAVNKAVKRDDPAYRKWVSELVKPLFEAPTITLRGKEVAPTLDNIVASMTIGKTEGAEKSLTFSAGKTAAMLGKRFKTLAEIKAARDQVVSTAAEAESKDEVDALLSAYRAHVSQFYIHKDWRGNIDTWAALDDSMEALARAGKRSQSDSDIRMALSGMGFKGVDKQAIDMARDSIAALRNAATDYFEAKPQRAVGLGEFKGAVVPRDASPETLAILEKHGITIEMYGKTEGARERAVNKLAKRLDKESGGVLFDRAGALYQRSQTITTRDSDAQLTAAQQITDTIAARWKNAPADIIVARNMQDASIPEAVRKHDAELKSQGATGEPRGFIYKGRVYLLSDQLKTTSDVIEVLFHESLGHYGLRGVFGESLKPILQQVGTMRRADVVAKAREYGLFDAEKVGENASDRDVWASMTDKQRLDAAEEVLAEMSQTRPDLGFVKRAISAIRNWLRANVPGFQNLRMKDADIVQAYILPARGWVERGGVAASANRQVANEPGARYSAREQDLLFSGDEAPTSGRPGYETDLFGDPLPISAGRLAPARPARTEVRGDAQPTTGLSDTAAPEGSYRVRTIIGQEVSRKLGADTILTPEQAAQATAYLYRSAVERFDAIVTDKNGKPLAVVGSFKGALTQTSIYPGTIIAEAVRVPGAARIWFSHNHPSGKSALSDADKTLNRTLSSVFDGTSIEPMGTLAVTGKSFEHVSPDGLVTSGATPAPSAGINVPVIERELDPGNKDSDITLDSPAKAREHGSALYRDAGEPGLMILDAQHRVAAWVPVRGAMKGKLMGTGGLDAVYRAVSESNAGSVIIIHGGELDAGRGDGSVWSIAQNLGAALRGTDVRVLDIIDVNKPRSAAETGANLVAGSVFSRTPGDQTQTEAFKRWFAGSRVVDAAGQPLVVYHGTDKSFTVFKANGALQAAYFSNREDLARSYANERARRSGAEEATLSVYLQISNPLVIDANGSQWDDISIGGIENNSKAVKDLEKRGVSSITTNRAAEIAEKYGFDGVVINNVVDGYGYNKGAPKGSIYVAFRPEQIKSAIGNNGDFDPTNPDIRFSRTSAATGAQSAWDAPTPTGFDDVIYKLQDKNIDAKRVIEAITKSVGKVADAVNVYLQEELFHGRAASRVAEFGARELKPMLNQMKLAGLTMDEVEEFLHARHAKEANAVIAQRNPGDPGMQDGGSGMTNADADAYFAKLPASQRSKLEAIAKRVDAMISDTRKLYVQYGLEDQAVVDGWTGMFKNYIPLMRENKDGGMGIGQGFSVKGKEVKGRTGSKRKVVDILANIAAQREKVIVRGEKNRVAQALVGLAWANPNKGFWEVRSQAPTERVYDEKLNRVVDRPDPKFKSRDNVVGAKVKDFKGNVTEQFVVFNEDNPRAVRMAAAMKNLDAGNLEGLLGVSAKITRYFSSINTQYNPVFGVVNLVRDVQAAMVNLAATPLAGQQAKIAKDTVSALAGIYGDIRKTRKGGMVTSKWAQLWEQMQEDGGTTGYRELFKTSADRGESLKAIINPDAWMDSKWGKVFTADGKIKVPMSVAKEKAGDLFNWLSDYNEAMENGVRLAAYKAALDKGMSRQQAASLSKNLTVNFNRKGQVGMQAGAVYAFFNAAMQGTARIGQTLFDMDSGDIKTLRLSKVGKTVVYGGVLLGVMQALALSAAGFDDEDPPEFVRERSLIIPTGGKTYISIPMPLGLHVIPGLGRHATEFALSGFSKPAERAVSVVGMFADAFNPIGNAGLSMQTVAPTALDPFVALSENRDWTGKPIARTSFNKAEPGHNQWKDTATGFSKTIAEAINWLSGGNEYVAGAFSPTPDQIDYLIAQVGGGVAREVSKVMQTGSSITSGEELPTYKMPLLGRFVGSANGQASQGSAFYANLNKLNALETEIKGLRKDGKYEEAAALVRERPESSLIAFANKAERDVQKLRRDKRELIANDADRDAVRAKEDQITSVMTRLNELTKKRTESVQ